MHEPEPVEARDPKAKAIIVQALNQGGRTLTFQQEDDGTIMITDETEHLKRLEEMAEKEDLDYDNY